MTISVGDIITTNKQVKELPEGTLVQGVNAGRYFVRDAIGILQHPNRDTRCSTNGNLIKAKVLFIPEQPLKQGGKISVDQMKELPIGSIVKLTRKNQKTQPFGYVLIVTTNDAGEKCGIEMMLSSWATGTSHPVNFTWDESYFDFTLIYKP